METDLNRDHWHLDKRVPITLILAIILQTAGVIWFASQLASKVEANTTAISNLAKTSNQQDERVRANTTSVAVIQQSAEHTARTLERIDNRLEELNKKLDKQ